MSKKIILIIFIVALLAIPAASQADQCNPGIILPRCICDGSCNFDDFVSLFIKLANWGLSILGGITVLLIIWSAWGLMTSAGNPEKIKAGQQGIINTLLGLFFVLAAWALVNGFFVLLTGNKEGKVFGNPWYSPKPAVVSPCPTGKTCTNIVGMDKATQDASSCKGTGLCTGDVIKDKNGKTIDEKYEKYYICCNEPYGPPAPAK